MKKFQKLSLLALLAMLGATQASALAIDTTSMTSDLTTAFGALLLVSVAILGYKKINGVTKAG